MVIWSYEGVSSRWLGKTQICKNRTSSSALWFFSLCMMPVPALMI